MSITSQMSNMTKLYIYIFVCFFVCLFVFLDMNLKHTKFQWILVWSFVQSEKQNQGCVNHSLYFSSRNKKDDGWKTSGQSANNWKWAYIFVRICFLLLQRFRTDCIFADGPPIWCAVLQEPPKVKENFLLHHLVF